MEFYYRTISHIICKYQEDREKATAVPTCISSIGPPSEKYSLVPAPPFFSFLNLSPLQAAFNLLENLKTNICTAGKLRTSSVKWNKNMDVQPVFKVNDKVRIIYQNGLFNHPLKALNILFNLQNKKKKKNQNSPGRKKNMSCIGLEETDCEDNCLILSK